jgi:hypothetical protein
MAVEASTPIGSGRAATAVTNAIRNAASQTGTSFNYLLATAKIESDLDPNLTMKSSSAAGLFQFIDQTWLGTLKQAGPAFGYGDYANAISRNSAGHYSVDDPEMRSQIMKLRNDPSANAVMAGVLTPAVPASSFSSPAAAPRPAPPRPFRPRRTPTAPYSTIGRAVPAACRASIPSSSAASRSRATARPRRWRAPQ